MSIRKTHGITLIETLVVLAIAVIVLLQGNLGGYNRARETRLIDGVMTDLVSAISMARPFSKPRWSRSAGAVMACIARENGTMAVLFLLTGMPTARSTGQTDCCSGWSRQPPLAHYLSTPFATVSICR
jgi:type II secretory pathway pseudopilin PulG